MRNRSNAPFGLWIGLIALFAGTTAAWGQAASHLEAVPAGIKVRQEVAVDGKETAEVSLARREYESIQVVVRAVGGNLDRVQVQVSDLTNTQGETLPSEAVTLYRAGYVPIWHSSPEATQAPGLMPDPLIPFVDPHTGEQVSMPRWVDNELEDGRRKGAVGFDVWAGHNQPVWLDIHASAEVAAGTYTGTITVKARNAEAREIPLRVTVWDFTLPAGPTHENHFGSFGRVAPFFDVERGSEEFHQIEDRFIAMMAEHRLNPPLPVRLRPEVLEDGSIEVSDELDKKLEAFRAKYNVTNFDVPRAPFPDILGENREKAMNYYRSFHAYLEEKGWAERAYLYMLDEPNDAEEYERVRQLGELVEAAAPELRRLVVEQPYIQNPEWGSIEDAVDIWCPLFAFIHGPSIERVQQAGDDVWSYTALTQRASGYHPDFEAVKGLHPPYWEMDFPVTSYRIAPWINRRYGITGLLYWSTVHWTSPHRNPWYDPGFRVRWNGEGFLFYPGVEAGIDGPIPSIRLKNLRDGMEDYEYFAILSKRGGEELVDEIVREAAQDWAHWKQDPDELLALRKRLAEAILARGTQ